LEGNPTLPVLKKIASLGIGNGFGELALMSDIPRMASVKTTVDTCFATLSRKDFNAVIRRAQKRKMNAQCEFLKNYQLFSDLS